MGSCSLPSSEERNALRLWLHVAAHVLLPALAEVLECAVAGKNTWHRCVAGPGQWQREMMGGEGAGAAGRGLGFLSGRLSRTLLPRAGLRTRTLALGGQAAPRGTTKRPNGAEPVSASAAH
ncbi:hypothetical protein TARUN_2452 [Trichoderma arundinaceum]|uniref:Uncharacterized protein n=1 Tax=Trichoderma arundinaceum TaxID=490622 RepID=A0A395NWC1_TRIAR|nr:hypothetical protein TARUN_2452 [Trichoderma arundinaceum]